MPTPTRLGSTEDAIRMAELTLGDDRLAALVDRPRPIAMPITGDVPRDGVLGLASMLREVFDGQPGRLVLATRRTSGPAMVLEDELAWWRQLRNEHDGHALVLCDWLVFVRDDTVLSLAELAGPPAPWAA